MGPLTLRSRDGKEPKASSVSPILDSRTLARHQADLTDQSVLLQQVKGKPPSDFCVCVATERPRKLVSRQALLLTSLTRPHRLRLEAIAVSASQGTAAATSATISHASRVQIKLGCLGST